MPLTPALIAGLLVFAGQPSGRPPTGPLQRYEPRIWDVTFDVTLTTYSPFDLSLQRDYQLTDAAIVMPVIFQSTFSTVQADSLTAKLWLAGRQDTTLPQRLRLDDGFPFQTQLAVIPVEQFTGKTLRWQVGYRVKTWSSRLSSESAAAAAAWPREWPAETADGLRPQLFVESDDPLFAQAVEDASGGRLRLVPPYLAAKDLVRYVLTHIRVSGDGEVRGNLGVLLGLEVVGARQAARDGLGGPHDLVCACVAILRAAGIPARPVIGIEQPKYSTGGLKQSGPEFVSWAEFYLPDAGWVPFDPMEMRGHGVQNLDVRRPWPDFGTMDHLNRRIPLAYHFLPPATLEAPYPAVWGWDPRPGGDPGSLSQIKLDISSRGRAPEGPG
jgi:transglutaminase-like putative cysteine protease